MDKKEKDFAKLVRDNKGTIYTVCYMFSNDNDEVNDLVQETLIHLWQGWDSFRGESEVNSWIYRVTLNTCISIDRKKKRQGKTEAIVEGIDLFDESDTRNRQTAMLHERISKLQPFDRAIVLLWLENMSYDEIGAIVGISAKNVSVRLVRIKEQLKKSLTPEPSPQRGGGGAVVGSLTFAYPIVYSVHFPVPTFSPFSLAVPLFLRTFATELLC